MTVPYQEDDFSADLFRTRSWDLWTPALDRPSNRKLIDTKAELMVRLAEQDMTLEHFLTLPAARPMPARLWKELKDLGYDVPER
jgi:hypothetical protein